MKQSISGLSDLAMLEDALENLKKENQILRDELQQYRPEINIGINYGEKCVELVVDLDGRQQRLRMNVKDFESSSFQTLVDVFSNSVADIYVEAIKDEISQKLEVVVENIKTIRGANKW